MSSPGRLSCEPGRELGGCSARPAPGPRQAGQQAGSGGGGLTGRRGAAALAVQAALLGTHPFVPFGFGGSPDGLGGAPSEPRTRAAVSKPMRPGRWRPRCWRTPRAGTCPKPPATCSASSARRPAHRASPGQAGRVDAEGEPPQGPAEADPALQRPRGRRAPSPPSPGAADAPAQRALAAPSAPTVAGPAHGKAAPRREASQAAAAASLQSRSLAALFDWLLHVPGGAEPAARLSGAGAGGAGGDATGPAGGTAVPGSRKVPLQARDLPPSFFTEPPPAMVGSLLYPKLWSAPRCPQTKRQSLAAPPPAAPRRFGLEGALAPPVPRRRGLSWRGGCA